MPTQLGVPVKLLHECEGHKVSVELTNGEIYRGMLVDAEDCMNLQMQQVVRHTRTAHKHCTVEQSKRERERRAERANAALTACLSVCALRRLACGWLSASRWIAA